MASIRSLKSNVSREEALRHFSPGGISGAWHNATAGPLRAVADFYIPFQIFRVEISNAGRRQEEILGIDAVSGTLDPYRFEHLPETGETIFLETRNCLLPLLDAERARELAITKVQRVLFTTGFFRMRNLAITVHPVPGEIYVPYWVGFRGQDGNARFSVLDAVRRQSEGSRVRRLLHDWLTSAVPAANPTVLPLNS